MFWEYCSYDFRRGCSCARFPKELLEVSEHFFDEVSETFLPRCRLDFSSVLTDLPKALKIFSPYQKTLIREIHLHLSSFSREIQVWRDQVVPSLGASLRMNKVCLILHWTEYDRFESTYPPIEHEEMLGALHENGRFATLESFWCVLQYCGERFRNQEERVEKYIKGSHYESEADGKSLSLQKIPWVPNILGQVAYMLKEAPGNTI